MAHERSLVQRYQGKSFALVGVSADPSPFEMQAAEKKMGMEWPSFWDGPNGPIGAVWEIDRYPMFFLIDGEGIVRLRQAGIPPDGLLEKKIDELLQKQDLRTQETKS